MNTEEALKELLLRVNRPHIKKTGSRDVTVDSEWYLDVTLILETLRRDLIAEDNDDIPHIAIWRRRLRRKK